ncbi:hypothetical protein RP29_10955 [Acidovorax temperans]|jgi:hypothetical protein|uniref:Lipoprotein n=1 Tax=Acidovorax temperans TaxID=80878 RepID=A0A0D7K851_9BURK|nr:hypothetical protein [Acidovorax temperans]KJA10521.1 hypothetical protein RP29_10955 [Acidovorax temperans]MBP8141394.1 hypothetical protein [Acidovorax sp.]
MNTFKNSQTAHPGRAWDWITVTASAVGLLMACQDVVLSGPEMVATAQAVACMTSERTLQLAPRGVAENRKALLEEISNALRSGECQWLFAGNRVTVYEQGDFYSHISNPQNGSTPKAQAERNWYVISEQAGLSPVSIER